MKHIVMFSRGASSAVLSDIVIKKYGKENTILLHTPTYAEHKDSDRFEKQVSDYLNISITTQADGRSLWELIEDNNCLPSQFIPFCTRILKQEQTDKFLKTLTEDYTLHYGFGTEEWRRIQKQTARFLESGTKSSYEIFDRKITNAEVKKIIKDSWKICLPEPYKYLEHNNCIPCFKGGKGHFERVARYYPEEFLRAAALEEKIGHTVFKDCTLMQLWEKVQSTQEMLFPNDYAIPCMCANT